MKNSSKEIVKLLIKILLILSIMSVAIIYYDELSNIDIRALISSASSPFVAYLTVLAVYAVKGAVFVIPASLIYISVGMAFQPLTAIIVNLLGIAIEVSVSYFIGRFLGGDYVSNLLEKNKGGKKLLELKEKNKQSSIFIVRFLPVFPIDFTSLFFGSMGFSFFKYVFFSVLGIAPRVILFTVLGDTIYDYIPTAFIIKAIIFAIPVAVIAAVIKWMISRRKK